MLINPSLYNFLEIIIFDFQIARDRVHPVQISSRSDHCITTDIIWKTPHKSQKWGFGSYYTARTRIFSDILFSRGNVELITIWNLRTLNAKIWEKNFKDTLKIGGFPHLWPPKIFFQKLGSITFIPLWCSKFHAKNQKKLMDGLRDILRQSHWHKDGHTDLEARAITKVPFR